MSNKKGIKRGSPEHAARVQNLVAQKEYDYRLERTIGMSIIDQEMCMALGRMGFRAGDFYRLQETLVAIRKEYAQEFLDDAAIDKEYVYAKSRFDRELNTYVPECMRSTWESRNDLSRHTPGLRIGPADDPQHPDEMPAYISGYSAWQSQNEVRKFKAAQTRLHNGRLG